VGLVAIQYVADEVDKGRHEALEKVSKLVSY